jgi:hypothetical protein
MYRDFLTICTAVDMDEIYLYRASDPSSNLTSILFVHRYR